MADVLLTGHTHLPFQQRIDKKLVVNPGSMGQPKHGRAEACYAIWERGSISLHAVPYDVDATFVKSELCHFQRKSKKIYQSFCDSADSPKRF